MVSADLNTYVVVAKRNAERHQRSNLPEEASPELGRLHEGKAIYA
jgi:hypothetical protein